MYSDVFKMDDGFVAGFFAVGVSVNPHEPQTDDWHDWCDDYAEGFRAYNEEIFK